MKNVTASVLAVVSGVFLCALMVMGVGGAHKGPAWALVVLAILLCGVAGSAMFVLRGAERTGDVVRRGFALASGDWVVAALVFAPVTLRNVQVAVASKGFDPSLAAAALANARIAAGMSFVGALAVAGVFWACFRAMERKRRAAVPA